MKFSALPIALLCITLLSACGNDGGSTSSSSGASEDFNPDRYTSGNCGSTVISDHNTVVIRCRNMRTASDARSCKSSAQSFLNKYPGISCQAEERSSNSVNNTTMTITPYKFQKVIDELTALGY